MEMMYWEISEKYREKFIFPHFPKVGILKEKYEYFEEVVVYKIQCNDCDVKYCFVTRLSIKTIYN